MIVRTYGRRTRSLGSALIDGAAAAEHSPSAADPFSFSSQDSSPFSVDPFDDSPPLPSLPLAPPSFLVSDSSNGWTTGGNRGRDGARSQSRSTATLMEAQEFGEMMEHVDEVNFALDGLRPGQPARIRRASLLSLLSICATAQQRRLLRAQGMAKRIIDAILGLSFDDSPSTIAAAALFYVLASDVQDDHLLDSPSCIQFLLKLLNPPMADSIDDKVPSIGSKLLGIHKPHILVAANKELDSSSKAIILKVEEILLSCKEIKSGSDDDDEGRGRPELSSKWISLLTIEKACLSTVSFEDTSDSVRRSVGNFKERLRDLGGLDAIFDVVTSCHSAMEGLLKHKSPTISELKDGVALQSVVLLLKCLKIMENATFLSKDNQNHLLRMKVRLSHEGSDLSFVAVIISAIKFLSGLSLIQNSQISDGGRLDSPTESVDAQVCHASEVQLKENHRDKLGGNWFSIKNIDVCQKRQRMSSLQLEASVSGSDMTVASGPDVCSVKKRATGSLSLSYNGVFSVPDRKSIISANGSKISSLRCSNGWISIKPNGSSKDLGGLCKRRRMAEDVSGGHMNDSYDPFEFDEDELEPSKWELLASRKETSQTHRSTVTGKFGADCQLMVVSANDDLSQSTNEENQQSCESPCPSMAEEDSTLLEDCLLTAIKVLMNLTNDNPLGCQQIGACDGLDTMASLIIKHFPSFDVCSSMHCQLKENISSSNLSIDAGYPNRKHLSDHKLDFLVAILGLLVNLVEKDSRNRSRLASARISVDLPGRSEGEENHKDVIPLLCSIFLANQGAGEAAGDGRLLSYDDEASLLEGEREAEMMIIEAYAALLLAFLSMESTNVRKAIASYLPDQNLRVLVPVLERFVAFHLTLNMISPETHSAVSEVIESCKES